MRSRIPSRDLAIMALLTVLSVAVFLVPFDMPAARWPAALLLVFWLPGWALREAILHGARMSASERTLYAIGLSVIACVLGAFALNALPWGLTRDAWITYLNGVTLAGIGVAGVRRLGTRATVATPGRGRLRITTRQAAMVTAAILLFAGAFYTARVDALNHTGPGFTQFSMIPANDGNRDGTVHAVKLSVANHKGHAMVYAVDLYAGGSLVTTWPSVPLEPGGVWEATFTLDEAHDSTRMAGAHLRGLDRPDTVIRRVRLWRYPGAGPIPRRGPGRRPRSPGQPRFTNP